MEPSRKKKRARGWYTVSVDTLRNLSIAIVFAALAAGGFYLYRIWEGRALEREAGDLIAEVEGLIGQAEASGSLASFAEEYADAQSNLADAKTRFAAREFSGALDNARRARALLLAILDAGKEQTRQGEAQFIAVEGGVEFRRGDRGEWDEARSRVVLQSGDYVKTSSNGSAEIVFLDGTLYTVRPNTLFVVTRTRSTAGGPSEQAVALEYGWVNLNTAQRGGRVTTPRAEAHVARESEAVVSFEKGSGAGRFSAFRGALEVIAKGGLTRQVGALQQVTQAGDLLSEPKALPGPPAQTRPADNFEATLGADRKVAPRLELAWDAVPGAARYALQVSRNRLFVDNLIDVDSRTRTAATLGLKGEGNFEWRVAAVSRDGLYGPWSSPRSFRVVAPERTGDRGDKTPPPIDLDDVQSYGSLFIVTGHTEPGAALAINGEQVAVAANGTFTKTVQLTKEGWSFIELRAIDPSGNETTVRRRVFVETL